MQSSDPITTLKGVGQAVAEKLARLEVTTIGELLYFFPRTYTDFSQITKVRDIQPGRITIQVEVVEVKSRYARKGLHITEAIIKDETGEQRAVWFNQPYRAAGLQSGIQFYMSGTFDLVRNRYVLQNPAVEKVSDFAKNTARIVPIYRETKGLKSHQIRQLVYQLIPYIKKLPETLPTVIIEQEGLLPRNDALLQIHFPGSGELLEATKERLGYEELFELLLASQLNKKDYATNPSWVIPYSQEVADRFTGTLPFQMTDTQRQAAWQILQDLGKEQPMNRLLQGDVGAGKTAVGAMAAFMTQASGLQTALLAPTGVLAAQHAETLSSLLEPTNIRIGLLIGGMPKEPKELLLGKLRAGAIDIIIGTHALLEENVEFARLGLIIIDEQHRFGVDQRKLLLTKDSKMPHVLSLTATPIPRSLQLTVYGELDVSTLTARPANRKPIKTEIYSPHARMEAYAKIEEELKAGHQAYVICPLVSESDTLGFTSVEQEYTRLQSSSLKHRRIGILHGRLSGPEKEAVMQQFQAGEIDILVATTVIEVGVDVPNATIMLIEGADRFGLAQLHQLRGRVGRGADQSYCILIPSSLQASSRRLQEVVNSNDGFYLAERDLELRGPGELYGNRQHGSLDLRIARIGDTKLIAKVQQAVAKSIEEQLDLLQYPELRQRVEQLRRLTILN